MDTQKILNKVLLADKAATDAYQACFLEAKQASILAHKKLNALLEKTKLEAQDEVARLWAESKTRVDRAMEEVKENTNNQERLNDASKRVEAVVEELIQTLLSQKQ
ncbi:MAG: hypothetical protein VB108_07510 [Anaerolineaceae bacterium]|nr:hypothetical protein [Anaerolineaceae bacterium]